MFASLPDDARTCIIGLIVIACVIAFKEIVTRYQGKNNNKHKKRK